LKKYLVTIALAGVLAACGGGSGEKKATDSSATTATTSGGGGDLSSNPDYTKGLDLIAKNDCLTCHDIATKKIGPAYQEVANKYAGVDTAVEYLSKKVIAGGSGVWGAVPMTPHPALSPDDAKSLVKYILLLKTK
jgi:cytochrome c